MHVINSDGRIKYHHIWSKTFHGVRVYHNTTQSHTNNNNYQTLVFNTETFDTDGYHSTVTNTDRITIPTGLSGYYQIGAAVQTAAANANTPTLIITLNGTSNVLIAATDDDSRTGSNVNVVNINTVYYLSAGDYILCRMFQDSGGNLDMAAYWTGAVPAFWAYLVGV